MSKDKPFRVSYYCPSEVVDGRAILHSAVTRAVSPEAAKNVVQLSPGRVTVKVYPFYRTLNTPTRRTWHIVSGPDSPATKAVLKDLAGFAAHDSHEQLMDTFSKVGDSRFIPYNDPAPSVKRNVSLSTAEVSKRVAADPNSCAWHGSKYMVNGRCTKLDPASTVPDWESSMKYEVGDEVAPLGTVVSVGASSGVVCLAGSAPAEEEKKPFQLFWYITIPIILTLIFTLLYLYHRLPS